MAEKKTKKAPAGRRTVSAPKKAAEKKKQAGSPRRREKLFVSSAISRGDFKPDAEDRGFWRMFHTTRQQQLRLLKWTLYIVVCLAALIIQDTLFSRLYLFGATTDLFPAAVFLIAVLEGAETGMLYAMLAGVFYHFSGSEPISYCVGLLSLLGMGFSLLRQCNWHRSRGSITFCASAAMLCYEILVYIVAVMYGVTRWDRLIYFLLTAAYSIAVQIPLYRLIYRIGIIGGNTWRE